MDICSYRFLRAISHDFFFNSLWAFRSDGAVVQQALPHLQFFIAVLFLLESYKSQVHFLQVTPLQMPLQPPPPSPVQNPWNVQT